MPRPPLPHASQGQGSPRSPPAGCPPPAPRRARPTSTSASCSPPCCVTCWRQRTSPPGPPPPSCCCASRRCCRASGGCAPPTRTCGSTAWTCWPAWRRSCTLTRRRCRRMGRRCARWRRRGEVRLWCVCVCVLGARWGVCREVEARPEAQPAAALSLPLALGRPPPWLFAVWVPRPARPPCALLLPRACRVWRRGGGGAPPAAAVPGRPAARRPRLVRLRPRLHAVPGVCRGGDQPAAAGGGCGEAGGEAGAGGRAGGGCAGQGAARRSSGVCWCGWGRGLDSGEGTAPAGVLRLRLWSSG